MICVLIARALNEGWQPRMDGSEDRYYPYFYLSSSGFVFYSTFYASTFARTASASRLCFKSMALAEYAGKTFTEYYKNFIMQ